MSNILLIEPDYRSKFPPLGLMRISTFHKERGDTVTFARGKIPLLRETNWHRIYISSLFTWELPRTVKTVKYYMQAVDNQFDIFVGGIAATLLPEYIRKHVQCKIIEGPLDRSNLLGPDIPALAPYIPDYSLIDSATYKYRPEESYFCRVTKGCIRNCNYCAVPRLEPIFGYNKNLKEQIEEVINRFGERQHIVLLDNNILAISCFEDIIQEIKQLGFAVGAKRNNRLRSVDFNQGIDARLITPKVAKLLASICLSPVRLAFDFDAMEKPYRRAICFLTEEGFAEFTNYVLFNFDDDPSSLYRRLSINLELSQKLNVLVTGFPMRFIPMDDVNRRYVSKMWNWRYLRGIQCILLATHGMVSPNPEFFRAAFGSSCEEFLEIISMPDRYIIHRNKYKNEAGEWRVKFKKLSKQDREEFLNLLGALNRAKNRKNIIAAHKKFNILLEHYYPNGEVPKEQI